MDGEPIHRVTFRVQHDCPVARMTADHPRLQVEAWSGHRVEVVTAHQDGAGSEAIQGILQEHLAPLSLHPLRDGAMAVWRPKVEGKSSISRRLEAHGLVWLQPLFVAGGWEQFEAISVVPGAEQAALDDLRASHPVRVLRREAIGADEVAGSLFMSMQPALRAPTDKQAEALAAAFTAGYYRSPRGATTAGVAARLGLGRSAFEERLRGAENRLMGELAPALILRRTDLGPS